MKRVWLYGSAALVAALLALTFWRAAVPDTESPELRREAKLAATSTTSTQTEPTPIAIPTRAALATDAAAITALRARFASSSLRGTNADGELALDEHGALRLDVGLVHRFEYYLTLIGEFDNDDIRALLFADVQRDHGDALAAAALAAFDRYLGLREELAATELSRDPAARFEQLKALRRKWFGADADAMFGAEETQLAYTLGRRALEQDATLDAAERDARLAELEAQRAPFERSAERDATATLLADQQTRQFDQLGTDAATRDAERTALWGEEAAQRLAALDEERARWDQRLSDYAMACERLRADARLSESERQRALADLLQRSFDANERVRVESLQAIGALPPGG